MTWKNCKCGGTYYWINNIREINISTYACSKCGNIKKVATEEEKIGKFKIIEISNYDGIREALVWNGYELIYGTVILIPNDDGESIKLETFNKIVINISEK